MSVVNHKQVTPIAAGALAEMPGPARKLITALHRQLSPAAVYIFGSRATGEAKVGSDLDLIVVMPNTTVTVDCRKEVEAICSSSPIMADVLLVPQSQFDDRTKNPMSFLGSIHPIRVL